MLPPLKASTGYRFEAAGLGEKRSMKEMLKQYLDQGISRRKLMKNLTAVGLGAVAAKTVAESLAPVSAKAAEAARGAVREVRGNGGQVYVQQLKAAGVEYYFFNPSTGDAPIYDAFVDEPGIQLIKGIQEGVVAGMADGYARLSGKVGCCSVANVGLPNAMTQLVNTFKDRIPLLLTVAAFGQDQLGRDGPQDYEHQELMMQPLTKWYWLAQSGAGIAEATRRAMKFAATPPGGPVFLEIPDNLLREQVTAQVMDQSLFDVPMRIRPDKKDIETVAKMLIEAKNPLLSVGDEITMCQGEKEVVELAELLGLPVAGGGEFGVWSKPFPTRNPLYLGPVLGNMRFPGQVDLRVNIGNQYGERRSPGTFLVSIRRDPTSLARVSPVDMPLVADAKLAAADLIAAVKSMATKERLKQIADERGARVRQYTKSMADLRQQMIKEYSGGNGSDPIKMERLGVELEASLDKDTIYVNDIDSGKKMDPFMSFGGGNKTYVANGPNILGWGMSAAFGAKLAQPNKQVVAVLGDGAFNFGGPQPLWSQARYKTPITNVVLNNHSYNNERNRIWTFIGGSQAKSGRDMTCYNGDPDVDCAKAAQAFGVEAEKIKSADGVKAALQRAKRANIEGRPYLLDIEVQRDGVGAASEYHPPFSVAELRTKRV
jgi:thiamine pyrophosphate-dependent acetolactate synthase large subunit-like protein